MWTRIALARLQVLALVVVGRACLGRRGEARPNAARGPRELPSHDVVVPGPGLAAPFGLRRTDVAVDLGCEVRWLSRRRIAIGLPLLLAWNAGEMRAVGRMLRAKRRPRWAFLRWARDVADGWCDEAAALAAGGELASAPKRIFTRHVAPALATAADELWRQEAGVAALRASSEALDSALTLAADLRDHLDDAYWPAVWARTDLDGEPPADVVTDLPDAIAVHTGRKRTAAVPATLVAELAARWRADVREAWVAEHENGLHALEQLDALYDAGELDDADLPRYATLVEIYRGHDEALFLHTAALARDPANPVTAFRLGRILLSGGDDAGIELVERAIALDVDAVEPGCELLSAYLRASGRWADLEQVEARARTHRERLDDALRERRAVTRRDPLVDHGLDGAELARVAAVFAAHPEVRRAYLARKGVHELVNEAPVFVVGVERRVPSGRLDRPAAARRLREQLAAELSLPGTCWFVVGSARELRAWFERVPRAAVPALEPPQRGLKSA